MNILALDTGTTSMRGILFNEKGETLFTTSCQTPLNYPGEYIEQSPHRLSDSLIQICKTVCAAYPVDAISLTAFRSTPLLVDRDGNALCDFIHVAGRQKPGNL